MAQERPSSAFPTATGKAANDLDIANPEDLGINRARLARLEARMQQYVDQKKLAGILTVVARRNQVAHFHAVGDAVIQPNSPMRKDTLFRIYSMTKPITSVAILMLMEEGLLRLQDPVAQYIPAFGDVKVLDSSEGKYVSPSRAITILDLLIHTSGLSYGFDPASAVDRLYDQHVWGAMAANPDLSLAELVDQIAHMPLANNPGAKFRYSVSTDVLGYVVEVVSGMPLDKFLQTRIFEPLGMKETGFHVDPGLQDRLAFVYSGDGAEGLKAIDSHLMTPAERAETAPDETTRTILYIQAMNNLPLGGGGLVSSASDYLQFARMLANNGQLGDVRILGRKTVELLTTNHLPVGVHTSPEQSYGFGLGVTVRLDLGRSAELGSVGMYGWGGAANTVFWIDPKEELILLFFAQYMPANTHPAMADFQTLAYQALD